MVVLINNQADQLIIVSSDCIYTSLALIEKKLRPLPRDIPHNEFFFIECDSSSFLDKENLILFKHMCLNISNQSQSLTIININIGRFKLS